MTAEEITNIAKSCIDTGLTAPDDSEDSWSFYDGELIQFAHKIFDIGRKAGMEEAAEIAGEWAMEYVDVDHAPMTCGESIRARMEKP